MTSNFLQRFKGKTQTISKQGVHDILGGGFSSNSNNAYICTHSNNGLSNKPKLNTTQTTNMNTSKNRTQQFNKKAESKSKIPKVPDEIKNQKQKLQLHRKQQAKKQQNPFLISNPFYLDEQERHRQEEEKKQQLRIQKLEKQKQKQKSIESSKDPKKGTFTSSMSSRKDSATTKTDKQWIKLGGLGANLGGQEWQEKRKKQQKMQQFANQVKAINTQKGPGVPKPSLKQQKKQDPRTKALQYSKKIPKPVVKSFEKEQKQQQFETQAILQINKNQLSELEQYQLRHNQLKQMLKNQL